MVERMGAGQFVLLGFEMAGKFGGVDRVRIAGCDGVIVWKMMGYTPMRTD